MKDYKEIASSVFQRRDEYLEEKKRKKALFIKSTAAALSCCVMLLVGFGIWRSDLLKQISPIHDDSRYSVTEADTTAVTTAEAVTGTASGNVTASAETSTTRTTDTATTHDDSAATETKAAASANTGKITTTAGGKSGSAVRTTDSSKEITTSRRTTVTTAPYTRTTTGYPRTTSTRTTTAYYMYTTYTSTTAYYLYTTYTSTTNQWHTTRRTTTAYPRTTTIFTTTTIRNTMTYPRTTWHTTTSVRWTTMTYPVFTTTTKPDTADASTHTGYIFPTTTTSTVTTVQYTVTATSPASVTTRPDYFITNGIRYNITHTTSSPREPLTWLYFDVMEAGGKRWTLDVYRYGDLDPDLICIASFDYGDTYCIGINPDFSSPDLGSALDSMDFDGIMEVGDLNVIGEGSYYVDKGRLLELLNPYRKTSELFGSGSYLTDVRNAADNGQPVPELDISGFKAYMTLTLPDITGPGHYYTNGYLAFTRYGYINFEVSGTKYIHYIGTEAADTIIRELTK